ncbi:iron-containing alcohol dehydrogenase, partial [uncultured Parasutterella sp.]
MFSFCIPTQFVFGSGSFKKLHQYPLPGKKALIVITNGGSVKRLGYLEEMEKQLEKSGVSFEVFDEIEPNPTTDNIM